MGCVSVPIEVIAIICILWFLPLKKVEGNMKGKLLKIDYLGVILVVASIVLTLLALNWGGTTYAWDSVQVLCTLIIDAVLMVTFVLVEAKVARLPIVPVLVFRNRSRRSIFFHVCDGHHVHGAALLSSTILPSRSK
ncbi:hypothetical protein AcW1_002823 [Taiwanofungus camphoratus]|nr:hypothetical protein AcW1_002823 [Antrodia cinnamomea]